MPLSSSPCIMSKTEQQSRELLFVATEVTFVSYKKGCKNTTNRNLTSKTFTTALCKQRKKWLSVPQIPLVAPASSIIRLAIFSCTDCTLCICWLMFRSVSTTCHGRQNNSEAIVCLSVGPQPPSPIFLPDTPHSSAQIIIMLTAESLNLPSQSEQFNVNINMLIFIIS